MNSMHYIGFDIHKKVISFCEKQVDGTVVHRGVIRAIRQDLNKWAIERKVPWIGAMEATLFTGWIYDFLLPYSQELKVAHPEMLKAITAAKKKNDAADAEKIADLLRAIYFLNVTWPRQSIATFAVSFATGTYWSEKRQR